MSSPVISARGRLGYAKRIGDPQTITDAKRDLAAANLQQYIEKVVSTAPPLTDEQRDRLAALLRSTPEPKMIRRPRAVDDLIAAGGDAT